MTMNDWDRIKTLFNEAIELDHASRARFLDALAEEDQPLRPRIAELLEFEVDRTSDTTMIEDIGAEIGTVIGSYKILERIGEGGFGLVYMAQQQVPIRRQVALKVLKPGLDSQQVLARFHAERQALAMMDHPGIARILDAGATESGYPYFAMELVRGEPITTYCDRHLLSLRDRIELFRQVCDAVQHAHMKGVIHRDLKPTNVLVTSHDGRPVVKVIDFGIAKALGHQLTDMTLFTGLRQFLGTPAYMAPEQAELSGLDVDTRSDVYSLGAMLYELLCGRPVFDRETLLKAGLDEVRRMIQEEQPARVSVRFSTSGDVDEIAAQHQSSPSTLGRLLRGDLDWITGKALEKDRRRRYDSASDFSADLGRYLEGDAVEAYPPSLWYRGRKFTSRHRVGLVVSTLVVVSLVAVGLVLRGQAREQLQKIEAETREQELRDAAVRGTLSVMPAVAAQILWVMQYVTGDDARAMAAAIRDGNGPVQMGDANINNPYQLLQLFGNQDSNETAELDELNAQLGSWSNQGAILGGLIDQGLADELQPAIRTWLESSRIFFQALSRLRSDLDAESKDHMVRTLSQGLFTIVPDKLSRQGKGELAATAAIEIARAHYQSDGSPLVESMSDSGNFSRPTKEDAYRLAFHLLPIIIAESQWGEVAWLIAQSEFEPYDTHPYSLATVNFYSLGLENWPETSQAELEQLLLTDLDHPAWISWVAMAVAGGDLPTCGAGCEPHDQPTTGALWKAKLALQAAKRAADLWSDQLDMANILLAEAYYKNDQFDHAVSHLETGIEARQETGNAHIQLEDLNQRLEKYKQAQAAH